LCVSVNDEVVHGMPSDRTLKEGDIVSLDMVSSTMGFTVTLQRRSLWTYCSERGTASRVTEASLYKAIDEARIGNRLCDISYAVQSHVEAHVFPW